MNHDNWYAMPPSPDQWQSFVFSNLARKVPEIPQYIAGIEFNRIDPVLGDADGLVYLIGGLAAVPVTIRQNRMAPLDVMVSKNEDFYPVSEAFLQKIYADNVLGEPSNEPGYSEDQVAEGPGQHIQYYNTVGGGAGMSAKLASEAPYATKVALRSEIEKSASLLTFFNDKMPDLLEVLYTAQPDAVKVASAPEEEMPDLFYMYRNENGYKCNGEDVTTKTASAFMDIIGFTNEDKLDVMHGQEICLDNREKVASIVLDSFVSQLPKEPDYSNETEDLSTGIATVVSVSGEILKGLLYREYTSNSVPNSLKGYTGKTGAYRHIFICDKGYAVQEDVFVIDIVPVELKHVREASQPTTPEVGKFGSIITNGRVNVPFNICAVETYGTTTMVRSAAYDMSTDEFEVNANAQFYDVVDNRIKLASNKTDAFHSVEGQNVSVSLNGEGKIVVASQVYDYNDAIYTLMTDYNLDYTDAKNVSDSTLSRGSVNFKIAAEKDKKDAKKEDKPSKGEKAQDDLQAQQAQSEMDASNQQAQSEMDAANQQAQQAQANQQVLANQGQMTPVSQEDLNDVAAMNDPSLMDAYITGKLTDVNTAGREQIMQASDAIIGAIKAVGRILFLTRLGKIEYVKEDDAQLALNKLSDVAKSIGIASSQLQ